MTEEKRQTNDMEVEDSDAGAEGANGDAPMEVVPGPSNEVMSQQNNVNAVKIMASSGTVGSVSISLHPLVIMNVSEHWTRLRAQEGSDQLGNILIIVPLIV